MNNPYLSVIIPIYKVEDYLERCVKSVLDQDYKNLEVILVDDGSPDRCPEICEALAKTDERIKVIHKPNGGLSSARNAGIDMVGGEYLAFLDSDDSWNANMLSKVMKQLEESKSTILTFAALSLYEDSGLYKRHEPDFFSEEFRTMEVKDYYSLLIATGNLHESACTHIIDRKFLINNDLYFKEGILCEDTEWMFRLLRTANTISISSTPLFICTENRTGSISNTASTKSVRDMISIIEGSIDYRKKYPMSHVADFEFAHCSYLWSICMGLYTALPVEHKPVIKSKLKEIAKKLNLKAHPKSRKVSLIYTLFGFHATATVLALYMKLLRRNMVNKKGKGDEQ